MKLISYMLLGSTRLTVGLPCSSDGKESTCNAGDTSLIPGLGKSPGEGNDHSFQYSCLENHMDRGAWQATVHGVVKESDMTERPTLSLSTQQETNR